MTYNYRRTKTITRAARFEYREVAVEMRIDRYTDALGGYHVSAKVQYYSGAHICSVDFHKVPGEVLADTAKTKVRAAIDKAYEEAKSTEQRFVRIPNMVGFAQDERLHLDQAPGCRVVAYDSSHSDDNFEPLPEKDRYVTVVRCADYHAAKRFLSVLDLSPIVDGDDEDARRFEPRVEAVYDAQNVLRALGGYSFEADDLATYLLARQYDEED